MSVNPILQSRWKLEGNSLVYYGLRNMPYTLKRRIRISRRTAGIISSMDGTRQLESYPRSSGIKRLIAQGMITDMSDLRQLPDSLENARYCTRCAANDYMIPGLEFDSSGLCPMCSTEKIYAKYRSILPVIDGIPVSRKSRFDAALFYTGGKDSSFLLYYLAVVKKLRVLALTWKIPFMSQNALQSIENARQKLPNVTFWCEEAEPDALHRFYTKLFELQGNVCACPSIAYLMFFERLVDERVPYLVLGNEPVQMKNLLYNGMAPKIAFNYAESKALNLLLNIPRVLTMKKPYRKGQLQMNAAVSQLVYGDNPVKKLSGYRNTMIENYRTALDDVPELCASAARGLRKCRRNAQLPALVHIDMNDISDGGVYVWNDIKQLLRDELGWVDASADKGLHTSCDLERCKEYSQLKAFREMSSPVIPFSAIELSLAVSSGNVSAEQALRELHSHSGFCRCMPAEFDTVHSYLSTAPSDK